MLDENTVITILSRHFPGAPRQAVHNAAEDVLLLELLAQDVGVIWEDAMRELNAPPPVSTFEGERRRRES